MIHISHQIIKNGSLEDMLNSVLDNIKIIPIIVKVICQVSPYLHFQKRAQLLQQLEKLIRTNVDLKKLNIVEVKEIEKKLRSITHFY